MTFDGPDELQTSKEHIYDQADCIADDLQEQAASSQARNINHTETIQQPDQEVDYANTNTVQPHHVYDVAAPDIPIRPQENEAKPSQPCDQEDAASQSLNEVQKSSAKRNTYVDKQKMYSPGCATKASAFQLKLESTSSGEYDDHHLWQALQAKDNISLEFLREEEKDN